MHYQWVETDEVLARLCSELLNAETVSLDTEFIRTRTYWPALALVQLHAPGKGLWLVDPLAVKELGPLQQLLAQAPRLVMHACGEDLEALQRGVGQLPGHLYDTQLAAGFAGLGQSMGYARLVEHFCQVTLDKEEARTDWLARPLSSKQLAYAANDVRYLPVVDKALWESLEGRGFNRLVVAETERLKARQQAPGDPAAAYLDVKNAWQLNSAELAVLQRLATWREQECQRRNLARSFVIRDEALIQLSQCSPADRRGLADCGVHPALIKRSGEAVLQQIQQGRQVAPGEQPERIRRIVDIAGHKQSLARLKQAVSEVAAQSGIPAEMLASKRLLSQYISWDYRCQRGETDPDQGDAQPEVIRSWRHSLLAAPLQQALHKQ